jgi:acetyl esterase
MRAFTDTPIWHRPNAVISWDAYLGAGVPGTADVPVYAAPARAAGEQLAGLPPAYISVMEFDPLRDEGIDYAHALLAGGVSVELHLFPGTFHGSGMIPHAEVSLREAAEAVAVLRRALR